MITATIEEMAPKTQPDVTPEAEARVHVKERTIGITLEPTNMPDVL